MPVLIVDEHDRRRLIHEELLRQHGMRPATAADEAAALTKIDRAAPGRRPLPPGDPRRRRPGPGRLAVVRPHPRGRGADRLRDDRPDSRQRNDDSPLTIASCRGTQFLTKPAKYSEFVAAVERRFGDKPQEPSADDTAKPKVRPLQILLAEDGLVNQEVAVGLLEMHGHRVEVANNGREALAALERQPFDLVLMDLEMPEMDGLEAAAAIRAKEQTTAATSPSSP